MLIRIHKSCRDVVAICDSDLIGRRFEQGKFQLDLKESFYKGKEIEKEELIERMINLHKEDVTFNIVGKESISCALKAGIISKEGIKKISGIPYTLIFL